MSQDNPKDYTSPPSLAVPGHSFLYQELPVAYVPVLDRHVFAGPTETLENAVAQAIADDLRISVSSVRVRKQMMPAQDMTRDVLKRAPLMTGAAADQDVSSRQVNVVSVDVTHIIPLHTMTTYQRLELDVAMHKLHRSLEVNDLEPCDPSPLVELMITAHVRALPSDLNAGVIPPGVQAVLINADL